MKTQTTIKCPNLVEKTIKKDSLKKESPHGGNPTILSPAEYENIQNEALSVMDSESGHREIFCPQIHNNICRENERRCCYVTS